MMENIFSLIFKLKPSKRKKFQNKKKISLKLRCVFNSLQLIFLALMTAKSHSMNITSMYYTHPSRQKWRPIKNSTNHIGNDDEYFSLN